MFVFGEVGFFLDLKSILGGSEFCAWTRFLVHPRVPHTLAPCKTWHAKC